MNEKRELTLALPIEVWREIDLLRYARKITFHEPMKEVILSFGKIETTTLRFSIGSPLVKDWFLRTADEHYKLNFSSKAQFGLAYVSPLARVETMILELNIADPKRFLYSISGLGLEPGPAPILVLHSSGIVQVGVRVERRKSIKFEHHSLEPTKIFKYYLDDLINAYRNKSDKILVSNGYLASPKVLPYNLLMVTYLLQRYGKFSRIDTVGTLSGLAHWINSQPIDELEYTWIHTLKKVAAELPLEVDVDDGKLMENAARIIKDTERFNVQLDIEKLLLCLSKLTGE